MTQVEKTEIKELITTTMAAKIDPLVVEFRSANEGHAENFDRLSKQSAEHYADIRALEEKMNTQLHSCQAQTGESQERMGERIGAIEREQATHDLRLTNLETFDRESREDKKFNISQWLVAAGVILMIVFAILDRAGV